MGTACTGNPNAASKCIYSVTGTSLQTLCLDGVAGAARANRTAVDPWISNTLHASPAVCILSVDAWTEAAGNEVAPIAQCRRRKRGIVCYADYPDASAGVALDSGPVRRIIGGNAWR